MSTPTQLAAQIEADFPGIWARIDKAQPTGRLTAFPIVTESVSRIYPKNTRHPCGYPLSYLIASQPDVSTRQECQRVIEGGIDPESVFVSYSADALQGVAAWRTTRLHYEFDPDFYDALAATPMKGTPPAQIFQHLPAKAFFLSRKDDICIAGDTINHGFFVVVFDDRLMMVPMTNSSVSSTKFVIRLNQESIELALDRLCEECLDSSIRVIRAHPNGSEVEKQQAINESLARWPRQKKNLRDTWGGALSCLMYLCTEAPDLDNKVTPAPKVMRMGTTVRYVPPKQDTQISVGGRLGSLFRKQAATSNNPTTPSGSTVASPLPPHIRRAHWHTYWTGAKAHQKPELRWLSPILVNAHSTDQLSETVHRVLPEERSCAHGQLGTLITKPRDTQ